MELEKNNTLLYRNYLNFSCTGSACPDNCCRVSTWSITLDKDTHELFEKLDDEFAQVVLDGLEYDENANMYKFKSGEIEGHCKMLNNDGLCEIHKRYGIEYLSDTCIHYPRSTSAFNGMMEWSLSNSCPIVVERFILMGKLKFQNVRVEDIKLPEPEYKEIIAAKIRKASIDVLQYIDLNLYDKLLWLNIIYRKLSKCSFAKQDEESIYNILKICQSEPLTDDILKTFKHKIESISLDILEYIYARWWNMLKNIVFIEKNPGNKELNEKVQKFINMDVNFFIKNTIALKEKLLYTFIRENEQVFENYLVKEVFDTKLPFTFNDFESAYITFASKYVLLQLLILALNYDKERLALEDIRNAIYYFHRKISHNSKFIESFTEYCRDEKNINWATLAAILY